MNTTILLSVLVVFLSNVIAGEKLSAEEIDFRNLVYESITS